jgi:outer membrane protein TolC
MLSLRFQRAVALALCVFWPASLSWAQMDKKIEEQMYQDPAIHPEEPKAPWLWRPYLAPAVPPIRMNNSPRVRDLIRGGNMYLSLQDAISLALENNIDIEVARYSPIVQAWTVERSEAGGALPGVPSNATQASSVASGQGVLGSEAAAGVSVPSGNGVTRAGGNSSVAQIGPQTQTLDPVIQESTTFSHRDTLQPDSLLSQTISLIDNARAYSGTYTQGFLIGGSVTVSYNNHYLNENSPTDVLNPTQAPTLAVQFQLNLLNGFGTAVGERTINVNKINFRTSDLNFRTQVTGVVVSVLDAYYALVADYESIRSRQSALEASQQFLKENQERLELGTLAELDVTTAQSQLAASEQDLVNSTSGLVQDEVTLKSLISRNGVGDPVVAGARIVPLDHIVIPDHDDLPPMKTLIESALLGRADLQAEKNAILASDTSAIGTKNGILPTLVAFGGESQAGTAGVPHVVNFEGQVSTANPYFVGGLTTALGQVFRRNFPTDTAGAYFSATFRNQAAQADYGIDQLSLRQQQLGAAKDFKQAEVDVLNAVVALRQARARYQAAIANHKLEEQLLDAEQKRFKLGASTPYNVISQQRDLAAAVSTEIAAEVSYSSAQIGLDQATGRTLLANHVNITEARSGQVKEPSTLPAALPAPIAPTPPVPQ